MNSFEKHIFNTIHRHFKQEISKTTMIIKSFISPFISPVIRERALFLLTACVIASGLMFGLNVPANATRLPAGVLNYVHQKDPKVQIRFDGVVIFSNGNTYLPIIPQDVSTRPDAMQVVATVPEKADYPELIQFDNNFFLIKILQTSAGRLTLPRLADVPIQLKEGLLPQDLVMPNHLYIPDELKVILGELPYDPSLENAMPKETVAQTLKKVSAPEGGQNLNQPGVNPNQRLLYAYDMDKQLLSRVDVLSKSVKSTISLGCMPASMAGSPDGAYLYAGCLSSNEVVVVDLGANLIKTRVGVGSKPQDLLLLPEVGYLVVGNRFEHTLDLINTHDLLPATKEFKINLPGRPGPMAAITERQILVADAYKNQIYQYDLSNRQLERTLTTLPDITALWIQRVPNADPRLWVASRTENKVQVIDLIDGKPIASIAVGSKPIAIQAAKFSPVEQRASLLAAVPPSQASKSPAQEEDVTLAQEHSPEPAQQQPKQMFPADSLKDQTRVYVLCAGDDRIDVIDGETHALGASIDLKPGMFPTAMVVPPSDKLAYVGGAGQDGIAVVDLIQNHLTQTVSVPFRTFSLTMAIPLRPSTEEAKPVPTASGDDPIKNGVKLEHAQTISPLERSQMAGGLLEKPEDDKPESNEALQKKSLKGPGGKPLQSEAPQTPTAISPVLMQSNLSVPAPQQSGGFQISKEKKSKESTGDQPDAQAESKNPLARFFGKKSKAASGEASQTSIKEPVEQSTESGQQTESPEPGDSSAEKPDKTVAPPPLEMLD